MRMRTGLLLVLAMLVGCSRPSNSYSRATPDKVVESAVLMVQNQEAERLTELIYAENIQMRSLLNQLGLALGAMAELSRAVQEKFPEELAEMRARIEAEGGPSILEQLTGSGRSRGSGRDDGARFRELAKRIFADPYGWLTEHAEKLDVMYLSDDSYGVTYDGRILLQPWGLLIQEKEDGWYLMLPTNLPGARRILPDTDDEYMLWGSLFKTLENGVRDMTRDVRSGRTTSMNQLGQSAMEKFAIPAAMVMYAWGKYQEEARREAAQNPPGRVEPGSDG
ncbi:MAG: hypothetical protein Kow0022_01850 [Phycisphaerales bacterium]